MPDRCDASHTTYFNCLKVQRLLYVQHGLTLRVPCRILMTFRRPVPAFETSLTIYKSVDQRQVEYGEYFIHGAVLASPVLHL